MNATQQLFLGLLTGHLVGEFTLRFDRPSKQGGRQPAGLLHPLMVTIATAIAIGTFHAGILAFVFASHYAKVLLPKPEKAGARWSAIGVFTITHLAHLILLLALSLGFRETQGGGVWSVLLTSRQLALFRMLLVGACGFIVCVNVGGVVVGMLTRPLLDEIRQHKTDDDATETEGLRRGGLYIGWLERALVFLLVMIDQTSGVGFLMAAKSILRFGDIKDAHQRRRTEYVIIGTFLSFGWALLASTVTRHVIGG